MNKIICLPLISLLLHLKFTFKVIAIYYRHIIKVDFKILMVLDVRNLLISQNNNFEKNDLKIKCY